MSGGHDAMKDPIGTLGKAARLATSLLVLISPVPARQDPATEGEQTRSRIEAWVTQLSSDRPDEREAAMEALRKAGAKAVPWLKQALAKPQDVEARTRLDVLLSEVDPSTFFLRRSRARENPHAGGAPRNAVLAALQWLARHQNSDGSWSADRFSDRCSATKCAGAGEPEHNIGVSALALLAFLGAGYTPDSKDELPDPMSKGRAPAVGKAVRSGLKWLISRQDVEGCVGERGMKYVYSHAIATLALIEAYGMTRADDLQAPAQKAADFLAACQNPE